MLSVTKVQLLDASGAAFEMISLRKHRKELQGCNYQGFHQYDVQDENHNSVLE